MSLALSYTTDQLWADKTSRDRTDWFNKHSDDLARTRGAVINALRDHAAMIAKTKAHEAHTFSETDYVNDKIDALDYALAPEVREWFEG